MILIGSRALLFRAPVLLSKPPVDFDFISPKEEAIRWLESNSITDYEVSDGKVIAASNKPPCEFELTESRPSNKLFTELVSKDPQTFKTDFGLVPCLNLLFTLKSTHKFLKNSPHFWKNCIDYHKMKRIGCEILPEYMEFFKMRERETYNYGLPKLNVRKDEFFNGDGVTYYYDHDSIHEAMKQDVEPAYKSFQKDGAEVACDKEKFFAQPEQVRLNAVLEESLVLSLERSQIPHPGKLTPKQSFMMALSKVCSSITSGWFRSYSYDHIFEVVKMYDDNYVEKFNRAVKEGIVKKL